jgi:hypothetical protein
VHKVQLRRIGTCRANSNQGAGDSSAAERKESDAQVEREAKKRWGKKFFIRNGESFSSAEKRNKHREQYQTATKEIAEIEAEIKRRLAELDWYQALRTRQASLRKDANNAQANCIYYRFTVGKCGGVFNEILGQGDTWEEAFAKADSRSRS